MTSYKSNNSETGKIFNFKTYKTNNKVRKKKLRYLHSVISILIKSSFKKSTRSSFEDSNQKKRMPKYLYLINISKDLYNALRICISKIK